MSTNTRPTVRRTFLPLTLLLLLLLLAGGCASKASPLSTYITSRDLYLSTFSVLVQAGEQKVISREQAREIELYRKPVKDMLSRMAVAALTDDKMSFRRSYEEFTKLIEDLIKVRIEVERKKENAKLID